jgi:MFS family permease
VALWAGQSVSEVGSQVSTIALPLLAVTVLGASTFQVSLLEFLSSLAFLLLALPAGVLVDRLRKRRIMVWSDVVRFAALGSIPVAAVIGHVTLTQLYIVTVVVGVVTVFFAVAYQSYLPTLLDAEDLVDGNGKLQTTESFARLIGPTLGGAIIAVLGAARTIVLDAASYGVSAISLALIRTKEPAAQAPEVRVTFRAAMGEGLKFVVGHPILKRIVACTATSNFFGGAIGSIQAVYLIRELHASTTVYGLVFSLAAVGGLVGGAISPWLSRKIGSARILWVIMMTTGPFYLLYPLAWPGWGISLYVVAEMAVSVTAIVYNVSQVSYRQSICPPELLGRMNASVRWIVWGTLPLGALLGGALGTWLGLRYTILLCGLGSWAAGLILFLSPLRRMRDYSTTTNG